MEKKEIMESFVDREIEWLMPRIIKTPTKIDEDTMARGIREYSAKIQDIMEKENRRTVKPKDRKKPAIFNGSGRALKTLTFGLQVNRKLDPRKGGRRPKESIDTERVRQVPSAEAPAELDSYTSYTVRQRRSRERRRFNGSSRLVFYRPLSLRINDSLRPCDKSRGSSPEPVSHRERSAGENREEDTDVVSKAPEDEQAHIEARGQSCNDLLTEEPSAPEEAEKGSEEPQVNAATIEAEQHEVQADAAIYNPLLADIKEARQEYLDLKNHVRIQAANRKPLKDLQPRSGLLRLVLEDDNENNTPSDAASTETIVDSGDKVASQTTDHEECVKGAETLSTLKGAASHGEEGEGVSLCKETGPSSIEILDAPGTMEGDHSQNNEHPDMGCPSVEPEPRGDDSESDDCAEHSTDHHDEAAQAIEDETQDIEGKAKVEVVTKPRRKRKDISGRKSLSSVRRSDRKRIRPLQYWKGERKVYERKYQSLPTIVNVELTEIKSPDWRPVKRTKPRRVQACPVKTEPA